MDRYIARTLMSATFLAWLVVVVLEAVFSLLGELGDMGRGHYGWLDAILFVLFSLPARAWQSFPMAVLIGTLLGLGNLAAQGELNAFRLAGCSQIRLGVSVLLAGIIMLVFVLPLGEMVAPPASRAATALRAQAIFDDVAVQGGGGFWVRKGQQMIRVGRTEADGSLSDIHIYTLDAQPQLLAASVIEHAVYGAKGWNLEKLHRTRFDGQHVLVESRDNVTGVELVDPQLARLLVHRSEAFSLPELKQYIEGLEQAGMQVERYRLAFWQRLTAPLAVLAMLMLSMGMVLGPLGRHGVGLRVLAGVITGLLFKLGSDMAAHIGLVYGGPPWIAAVMPSLLVFAVALVLVRRTT
ncbi:lipopolysaccharide export system permease protein [Thiogranum longum]|uniref:Lipopolysaccharide export system permease protein n=1 Tax=Thiogranum longum TaxID=1537524 RepID=A0A4V2PH20_9GAMM|nr:LPS export ABC transporter permease LptG [Thiogranum longum]TCK19006.1 lipopolysaccharide export system permease protein [Thiogranum longum]